MIILSDQPLIRKPRVCHLELVLDVSADQMALAPLPGTSDNRPYRKRQSVSMPVSSILTIWT
jgi:hypothetical protein